MSTAIFEPYIPIYWRYITSSDKFCCFLSNYSFIFSLIASVFNVYLLLTELILLDILLDILMDANDYLLYAFSAKSGFDYIAVIRLAGFNIILLGTDYLLTDRLMALPPLELPSRD